MMTGGKWNCKKLCPVSFGLAVGITFALAVLIWAIYVLSFGPTMYFGTPADRVIVAPSFTRALILAFWALVKGFIFGFFIALFYDLISCCCGMKWCCGSGCACGKAGCTCSSCRKTGCTCSCCAPGSKSEVGRET